MKTVFQSQFFRDATGALSMMRLLSFLIVVTALPLIVGLCIAVVSQGKPEAVIPICVGIGGVIGLALGCKMGQAFAENKSPLPPLSDLSDKSDLSKARLAAEAERV